LLIPSESFRFRETVAFETSSVSFLFVVRALSRASSE
jgi:hypothetical protein